MAVRKYKPTTPSERFHVGQDFSGLTAKASVKGLLVKHKKSGGRNNQGHRTVRQRGGGHKRAYRLIDFKRNKFGVPATVKTREYDPGRSAYIMRLDYQDGEKRYILAPKGVEVGDTLCSGAEAPIRPGNALPLRNIPVGSFIHNIELRPGAGGTIVRSAGGAAKLMAKDGEHGKYVTVRLPSKERRKLLATNLGTIGVLDGADHSKVRHGKAGRARWLGHRPHVRGVAMNPVDHPMGGGEGKASGGQARSRTGLLAKGKKTRHKKKASNKYIVSARKK